MATPVTVCEKCGSDNVSIRLEGVAGSFTREYITCQYCNATTETYIGHELYSPFNNYENKDLVEILVALSLLAPYPEAISHIRLLQKEVEAVLRKRDG